MEQVEARQRIKVATKDHVLISMLHFKLHREYIPPVVAVLLLLTVTTLIVVGIAQPNVKSEWKVTGLRKHADW